MERKIVGIVVKERERRQRAELAGYHSYMLTPGHLDEDDPTRTGPLSHRMPCFPRALGRRHRAIQVGRKVIFKRREPVHFRVQSIHVSMWSCRTGV